MYTHVLLITLLSPRCVSDQYDRFNDECTHAIFNDELHTSVTDNNTYTMLYVISPCLI